MPHNINILAEIKILFDRLYLTNNVWHLKLFAEPDGLCHSFNVVSEIRNFNSRRRLICAIKRQTRN